MYSVSTLVFVYLSISISQKISGEASPCGLLHFPYTYTWTVTDYVQPEVEYYCTTTVTIPLCFGGCAATMGYKVHVSDTLSSKSRCSVDVHQCRSSGPTLITKSWDSCVFVSDGTAAPNANVYDFAAIGATGCSCQRQHYPNTASSYDCENLFIVD